jgi:hypothetical protein
MFNWSTAPTFAVMLVFWLLAAYILTRGPRGPVSLVAAAAEVSAAAFLFGQGMAANATNAAEWRPWERNLIWGATLAPALWYWLTVLLLREQGAPRLADYTRRIALPLGVAFGALSVAVTALVYDGDHLFRWSAPLQLAPQRAVYSQFHVREGPLYGAFMILLVGTTVAALVNMALAWQQERDASRRKRLAWLLPSAVLFLLGANTLGLASSMRLVSDWANVPSHLALGAAMLMMVWNVAAYSLLLQGQVIRRDALYFLTSLAAVCLVYAAIFLAFAHGYYSFQLLGALMAVLVLAVVSHGLFDVGRRSLDRLFFSDEVQALRSNLSDVVLGAALTPSLSDVIHEAQQEVDRAAAAHFARVTEEALRRINNPAALARSGLAARIPLTLHAAAAQQGLHSSGELTPLQQAQCLRAVLTQTLERLRPQDAEISSPAALHYRILREEYMDGEPNKQIMLRHSISESTFHRIRRDGIAILARELREQEELLSSVTVLG